MLWRRVWRLDIQGTVEDQVALVAFPFAEGTEILEGAKASLLEAPYLRFAGAWSWARRIGPGSLVPLTGRSWGWEAGGASGPHKGLRDTHTLTLEAGTNGMLTLAGLCPKEGLEHVKEHFRVDPA